AAQRRAPAAHRPRRPQRRRPPLLHRHRRPALRTVLRGRPRRPRASMTLVGWLLVGLGGACGAAARHALALWITRAMAGGAAFPIGIFIVNVLGSAAAGTVAGLAAAGRFPSGDGLR